MSRNFLKLNFQLNFYHFLKIGKSHQHHHHQFNDVFFWNYLLIWNTRYEKNSFFFVVVKKNCRNKLCLLNRLIIKKNFLQFSVFYIFLKMNRHYYSLKEKSGQSSRDRGARKTAQKNEKLLCSHEIVQSVIDFVAWIVVSESFRHEK